MTDGTGVLGILSSNIKNFRKQKGWTQEKLAEKAELSVQAINFFEGKRRWPGEDSISKIANALEIEVYQLFVPQDITPVIIEETPENERLRRQITGEVVADIRRLLNAALDKMK